MIYLRNISFLLAFGAAAWLLGTELVLAEQSKETQAELVKRLDDLQRKAKQRTSGGKIPVFVSRGRVTIFGIDVPTISPTQRELDRLAETEGN